MENAHGDADCLGCAAADSSRHADIPVPIWVSERIRDFASTDDCPTNPGVIGWVTKPRSALTESLDLLNQ